MLMLGIYTRPLWVYYILFSVGSVLLVLTRYKALQSHESQDK